VLRKTQRRRTCGGRAGAAGIPRAGLDLDPQQNTASVLLGQPDVQPNLFHVLVQDEELASALYPQPREQASAENLTLAPGHIDLTAADILLGNRIGRETLLRKKLAAVAEEFDFVLVDTPPSLGLLTVNALTAADELLVPVSVNYFALQGARMLEDTIAMIRENLGHQVEIGHVLCTFYDPTTKIPRQALAAVKERFDDRVLDTVIPKNVDLEYAHSNRASIFQYDATSSGGRAYQKLTDELLHRLT
jgi:chromosome partitioning protein